MAPAFRRQATLASAGSSQFAGHLRMRVAQLETPSSLKPGLQLCGNSCHSSPLVSHCGLSSGRPTYGSMVPG